MSLRGDIKTILFSEEEIRQRSKELGEEITRDYGALGQKPLVVALLRGSVPFLSELIKFIDLDIQYDFMDVTSYSGTKSTGDIRILKDMEMSAEGQDILIVEDIIDTGRTIHAVKSIMEHKGANSVKIVTLLNKPGCRVMTDVDGDYIGFNIENHFVVGYGLDYNQRYRCLPFIGILKDEVYQ
jgi:hypoxanthine phosphoribosyltransferase